MNDFEIKKEKWLREVSDTCHEFALKIDLDFYVFQTQVYYNPDLLIIGINPGSSKTYQKALNEKKYDKRPYNDLGYDENTLVRKPQWEIDEKLKGADRLRGAFKKVFNEKNDLDILEHTIMMNMFYFNTTAEKDISKIEINKEIKAYCIEKTLEFIEILNPKNILFLTSSHSNLKNCTVKEILPIENNIQSGKLGQRIVYSIPHYAARGNYYSYDNSEKMGKSLSKLFIR